MGLEIDFLPVGDGERSGDAIALRFGDFQAGGSNQFVAVIDGGTKDSGKALVEHIRKFYRTEAVNLVISTHPHSDHASGLTEVFEQLRVKQLWMHRPWLHSDEYKDLFKCGRITESSLEKTLQESLNNAFDVEELARKQNAEIVEPFSDNGVDNGYIRIIGPSTEYYEAQLANFRGTPQPKSLYSLVEAANRYMGKMLEKIEESWAVETLGDPDDNDTSAENNSSAIALLTWDSKQYLFTGDAGAPALREAVGFASANGISLSSLQMLQLPHHGSKHNIGKSLLTGFLGMKVPEGTLTGKTVYISCAKNSEKHPNKPSDQCLYQAGSQGLCCFEHTAGTDVVLCGQN